MRGFYTNSDMFVAWIKKKLDIQSPSAIYCSEGKYRYSYDYMKKINSDYAKKNERGE